MTLPFIVSLVADKIPAGTVIGEFSPQEHISHRDQSEYAAWFTAHRGDIGRFPITIGYQDGRAPCYGKGLDGIRLAVEIPSTITANDHASRYGGVCINGNGINDRVGERSSFRMGMCISCWLKGKYAHQIRIKDEFVSILVEAMIASCKHEIAEYKAYMEKCWSGLDNPLNWKDEVDHEEGRFKFSAVGHAGENIRKYTDYLTAIWEKQPIMRKGDVSIEALIGHWIEAEAKKEAQWDKNDSYNGRDTRDGKTVAFVIEEEKVA